MSAPERDALVIEELELSTRIGVPDEERRDAQRLTISMTLWPTRAFDQVHDDLGSAVDYTAVARTVQQFASARADKLIETLAHAIASHLLRSFAVERVRIELRKFILPDAKFVAAVCERRA